MGSDRWGALAQFDSPPTPPPRTRKNSCYPYISAREDGVIILFRRTFPCMKFRLNGYFHVSKRLSLKEGRAADACVGYEHTAEVTVVPGSRGVIGRVWLLEGGREC